jgi:hypothetical protein
MRRNELSRVFCKVIFQSTLLFSQLARQVPPLFYFPSVQPDRMSFRLHHVNDLLVTPSDRVAQVDFASVTRLQDELYGKRDGVSYSFLSLTAMSQSNLQITGSSSLLKVVELS